MCDPNNRVIEIVLIIMTYVQKQVCDDVFLVFICLCPTSAVSTIVPFGYLFRYRSSRLTLKINRLAWLLLMKGVVQIIMACWYFHHPLSDWIGGLNQIT